MPFTRPTFYGASVVSISTSLGWGSTGSSLEAKLVEDTLNGDVFTPGIVGAAGTFTLGAFTFSGILQKYTSERSKDGYPIYNVRLQDPRHLLDQTKIITSDYRSAVTGIYNLINVFGYWENTGYGNSQVNDTGMPWELIRDGILAIVNNPASSWGGPITYRTQAYSIDLSELPALPSYYRLGGRAQGMSIMDFITQCCECASYDYYIRLSGFQIQVKTVARANAYPLGTIGTMLSTTFAGSVIRSSDGVEERDETTSVFLVGGDVHELVKIDPNEAIPFWGFDATGTIMVSGGGNYTQYANFSANDPNSHAVPQASYDIYSYPVRTYTLYTPDIAAIIGNTQWFTNDLELQIILGLGGHRDTLASWSTYLRRANPSLYRIIALSDEAPNVQPPVGILGGIINYFAAPNNTVNTSESRLTDIQRAARGTLFTSGQWRLRTVFEAISKFAKDYYGKKFAVRLPNVLRKIDVDTGVISNSHDIADGGWVDATDPNDLLSLPSYASDIFQTQDGRYVGYVKYNALNADLSRVNPANSLTNGNDLYVKTKINPQIYFDSFDTAYAVVEVDPIYDYPNSVVGLSGVIGPLYVATGINYSSSGVVTNSLASQRLLSGLISNQGQGSIPLVIHPAPRLPTGYEIPIRSNVLTYGPWYAQGATGRVNYEQDSSLVPWNYGSYSGLNLAGNAKSAQGISQIQVIETGYVEVVGYPAYNIGDVIQANGPNITNISIGFGKEGVTTTYRFETYVPRFGQLGKYNLDRFKKLNINNTKVTADFKARSRLATLNAISEGEANRTLNMFSQMHEAINIRSPQNVIVAKSIVAPSGQIFPVVSTTTYPESLGFISSQADDYNATTIGTWEQIINPYALYHNGVNMPRQNFPTGNYLDSGVMNASTLSPWKHSPEGFTIQQYTKGDGVYQNINDAFNSGVPRGDSSIPKRVFGLRGPVVIQGWGYDIEGNRTPTGVNYMTDASSWKVGPIDPLWDNNRNVWSVHDLMNGITQTSIPWLSSGLVTVYKKGVATTQNLYVYDWRNKYTAANSKITLGYVATDNRWYVINTSSCNECTNPTSCPCTNPPSGLCLTISPSGCGYNVSPFKVPLTLDTSDSTGCHWISSEFDDPCSPYTTGKATWIAHIYGDTTTFQHYWTPASTTCSTLGATSAITLNTINCSPFHLTGHLTYNDTYVDIVEDTGSCTNTGDWWCVSKQDSLDAACVTLSGSITYDCVQRGLHATNRNNFTYVGETRCCAPNTCGGNWSKWTVISGPYANHTNCPLNCGSGSGSGGGGGGGTISRSSLGTHYNSSTVSDSLSVTVTTDSLLVITIGSTKSPSSVTFDGSSMTFDKQKIESGYYLSVYSLPIATGTTANITINFSSAASFIVEAIEIIGLTHYVADKTSSGYGYVSTPDTGSTATTIVADEYVQASFFCLGTVGAWAGGFSSGQSDTVLIGSDTWTLVEGYKVLSATGNPQGLLTGATTQWIGCLVTYM